MTALARDPVSPGKRPLPGSDNRQIVNTSVMYKDAFAALCTPTHGTAASRGRVKPWSGAAGEMLLGRWGQGKTTGDTSASPIVNGQIQLQDTVVENVLCAGLASSEFQRDALSYVYAGDDNLPASLTLTRPAAPNDVPVGIVYQGRSATRCDVLIFGFMTRLIMDMNGGNQRLLPLGAFGPYRSASGDVSASILAPCHGKILTVYGQVARQATDADVSSAFNLEIGGTNVTGGVVTWLFSDAAGVKLAGTTVTGANEFHAGDAIDVEIVATAAGTATDPGLMNLFATYECLPGL